MKVLVLGANGMLGHKLVQVFSERFETFGTVRGSILDLVDFPPFRNARLIGGIDVRDFDAVEDLLRALKPQVIVNAVGIIKQKHGRHDVEDMNLVNGELPLVLSRVAGSIGARFIGISTDCVFKGTKGFYNEMSVPDADDSYGLSKLAGEAVQSNSLVVRTSIVGRELTGSHGLLEWFLSQRGTSVGGYRKAIFSGLPTIVLAELLRGVIIEFPDLRGLYHISSEPISKYDLLARINEAFGCGTEILPDESLNIDRSLDSAKFRSETGFVPESWDGMIERMREDASGYEEWRKR